MPRYPLPLFTYRYIKAFAEGLTLIFVQIIHHDLHTVRHASYTARLLSLHESIIQFDNLEDKTERRNLSGADPGFAGLLVTTGLRFAATL